MKHIVCECGHTEQEHDDYRCAGNYPTCKCTKSYREVIGSEIERLIADNAIMREALLWMKRYYGGDVQFKAEAALKKVTHE